MKFLYLTYPDDWYGVAIIPSTTKTALWHHCQNYHHGVIASLR